MTLNGFLFFFDLEPNIELVPACLSSIAIMSHRFHFAFFHLYQPQPLMGLASLLAWACDGHNWNDEKTPVVGIDLIPRGLYGRFIITTLKLGGT